MSSGKFRLPGKKQLDQNASNWSVLVVDVTESPIERPKKTAQILQWEGIFRGNNSSEKMPQEKAAYFESTSNG